jgi:hypothetical protein
VGAGPLMAAEPAPRWMVIGVYLYALVEFVLSASVLVGFAFQSRPAVYAALGAFAVALTLHVLAGVIEYRRTMRRPWPKVAPLVDDDD